MVVLDNILIGRVVFVSQKTALVETLKDNSVKVPVVIKKPITGQAEDFKKAASGVQARGILTFEGEKLVVDQILQAEDIKEGDLVLTGGPVEGDWLPDLLVGQVEEVLGREALVYKKAIVSPLIDEYNLETVFVVTDW